MFQVEKRDGAVAEFQLSKISDAIGKAFEAEQKNYSRDMLDMLAPVSYTHLTLPTILRV